MLVLSSDVGQLPVRRLVFVIGWVPKIGSPGRPSTSGGGWSTIMGPGNVGVFEFCMAGSTNVLSQDIEDTFLEDRLRPAA